MLEGEQESQLEGQEVNEESITPHPNALPNYQSAVIPQDKIAAYILSPTHKIGRHKAHVFKTVLAFEQNHWEALRQQIIDKLPYHEAETGLADVHGKRYAVDLPIIGLNGKIAMVRTCWIYKTGDDHPTLTTAWVLPEK